MRIGLDVRYLSHGLVGGIHTYLQNFVPALLGQNGGHKYYLYIDNKRPFELESLPGDVTIRYLPYRNPLSSVYNDFFMRQQMAKDKLDVVHFTGNYGFGPKLSRTVITLQDEINILPYHEIFRGHAKNLRTIILMIYLHLCTPASLRRADLVITASEYSKRQIARYSSLDPKRIVVVPHAVPGDISRIDNSEKLADFRQRYNLNKPFIFADAFKNPGVLIRAWNLLPASFRKDHEIIFISRSEKVLPVVEEAVKAGFARLYVRIPRWDISAFYSMAQVFIFPSWIEGFGIPLLEAMTCGAPVIASNRGSIPEVAGDAAFLIDAEDEFALSKHLADLLASPEERLHWRDKGYKRAAQFSWSNIARQVLNSYHFVHSN
jgi:glycosyltransferase involved in cell wall biosynthesis